MEMDRAARRCRARGSVEPGRHRIPVPSSKRGRTCMF
jgi:hypothetical protein